MPEEPCPCGSGAALSGCCGPLLGGAPAPTAERLMRSRFTASALADRAHLIRTWHPTTRPRALDLDAGLVWRRLQLVDVTGGGPDDERGEVAFRASFRRRDGSAGIVEERSRFVRDAGRWSYLDGAPL